MTDAPVVPAAVTDPAVRSAFASARRRGRFYATSQIESAVRVTLNALALEDQQRALRLTVGTYFPEDVQTLCDWLQGLSGPKSLRRTYG